MTASTKILVTGAPGYIGMGVASALVRRGHDVLGTVRNAGNAAPLVAAGITTVEVDLRDDNAWPRFRGACR
jgi:nucleoside-diphosphate-sugar epimerase